MPRHRRFLSLWITTGLVLGVGGALLGIGDQAFEAADVVAAVAADSVDREQVVPDTTLPTDAPTSAKNSTAGSLVLVGVVVIIATAALVLTRKYRKR
jgi:hypothetical protein